VASVINPPSGWSAGFGGASTAIGKDLIPPTGWANAAARSVSVGAGLVVVIDLRGGWAVAAVPSSQVAPLTVVVIVGTVGWAGAAGRAEIAVVDNLTALTGWTVGSGQGPTLFQSLPADLTITVGHLHSGWEAGGLHREWASAAPSRRWRTGSLRKT
jgi:hypothetical protein